MGIFGSSRKRSNKAAAVVTGAGSGIGAHSPSSSPAAAAGWSAPTSTRPPPKTTADAIIAAGGEALGDPVRRRRREDVVLLAEVAGLARRSADLVVNNAGVGRRQGRRRDRDRGLAVGARHQPVGSVHGCHVFTPRLRAAGERRDHQRRLRRGLRRRTADGGLQRQQGRRAGAVGDPGRRAERHRHRRDRAVPDLRQDQHHRGRPSPAVAASWRPRSCAGPGSRPSASPAPGWTRTTAAACTWCRSWTPS